VVEVIGLRLLTKTHHEKPIIEKLLGDMMSETTNSNPLPFYFISYSRQEVTFVDSFSRELEKRGIRNWVDFRNLVPGHPWQPQLDEAVQNADAILLVVSKASMFSGPVNDEWTKSLAAGRRIILILFEPCKLDPGLAGLEWVDFKKNYEQALHQLMLILLQPSQAVTTLPQQSWIRIPGAAKQFMVLSLLLAVLSLVTPVLIFVFLVLNLDGSSEPIYEPLLTIQLISLVFIWFPTLVSFAWLPIQILRRTHNAQKIRNSLFGLFFSGLLLCLIPLLVLLSANLRQQYAYDLTLWDIGAAVCVTPNLLIIMGVSIYLYRLLTSDEMYRWSGPAGALIRAASPDLTGHTDNGIPMMVAVESAPQDRLYAKALKASIAKAGHICTDDIQNADIVLPLLSVHKTESACDPETTRLIPVLIQRCDVDRRLSRVQWVDLRYGKVSMDAVAHLLDEPRELLRMLGVLPVRMTILPSAINSLNTLLSIILVTTIAVNYVSILNAIQSPGSFSDQNPGLPFVLLWNMTGYYSLKRYVTDRKLKYLSFLSYWWAVGSAVLLALTSWISLPWVSLPVWLVPLLMLRRDVRLWLPSGTRGEIFVKRPSTEQPAAPG